MPVPEFKDLVGNAITSVADAGEGTITLGSALGPASDGLDYVSFATAYGADATVYVTLVEGTEQSVEGPCAYTHSGTTLSRGTVIRSTTGARLAMTSAGEVFVTPQATHARLAWIGALDYTTETLTTGNATVVVNTLHDLDIDGMTAARDFVLPATAAVGDRVAVRCSTDAPSTAAYVLQIKNASGDTIDGTDHSSTIKTALFIKGEIMVFRCVTASSAWITEHDGRIAQKGFLRVTTLGSTNTGATITKPSDYGSYAGTAENAVGCLVSTSAWTITVRRAGSYDVAGFALTNANVIDGGEFLVSMTADTTWGSTQTVAQTRGPPGAASLCGVAAAAKSVPMTAAGVLSYGIRTTGTNNTGIAVGSNMTLSEVLR